MPSPIVFLSGAGLPPWIWDEVRGSLPHDSVVAAYPTDSAASLRDYAEAVLAQAPAGEFTLVAHSLGGVVGSEVLAAAPGRVQGFLGVSGCLPGTGRSFLGSLPRPQGLLVSLLVRVLGTRPPEKQIRNGVGAGLDAATADRIVADFSPESQAVYRDAVSLHSFPARRGYVTTTRDKEFTPAVQERFRSRLGVDAWSRSIDTGHLPMLERPRELTDLIAEFVAQAS